MNYKTNYDRHNHIYEYLFYVFDVKEKESIVLLS